jgi:hypothetical protein
MTDQGTTAPGMAHVVVSGQGVKRETGRRMARALFACLVCSRFYPDPKREAEPHPFLDMVGYCRAGFCASPQILGGVCAIDSDCDDAGNDAQIFCSPGGICGGGLAQCEPDPESPSDLGESRAWCFG